MSFYRSIVAAVAALGLASTVFAANTTPTQNTKNAPQTVQLASPTTTDNQTKVNINTATAKELMKVKGLNAAKAKAIISFRKKHGDFKSIDDLKLVKGFKKMNEAKMKEVEEQLTIG